MGRTERTVGRARCPRGLSPLALTLVAVAGGLCLALPFWGDQALFTIYGRELTRGAVLYRDVGSFVESRFPKIVSFIRSAYEVAFVEESGTWYRLR